MALGKIKTLFSDKGKTEALFPRTKTSAVSNADGVGLDALLENIHTELEDKATQSFVINKVEDAIGSIDVDIDLSDYATKEEIATLVGDKKVSIQINEAINNIEYPVNSVNGKTGNVVIDIPVTSVNGKTGNVVIDIPEAPVTSVNGMTGDVVVEIPEVEPQVQADWAQNDETAVDYIKNRFFWKEGEDVVLFEEDDIVFVDSNGDGTSEGITRTCDFEFEVGREYSAIINGTTHNFIAEQIGDLTAIGYIEPNAGTYEIFMAAVREGELLIGMKEPGTYSIKIIDNQASYHFSEGFVKGAQADWAKNDRNDLGYVKNRPTWKGAEEVLFSGDIDFSVGDISIDVDFAFKENANYTLVIGANTWEFTAYLFQGIPVIGDLDYGPAAMVLLGKLTVALPNNMTWDQDILPVKIIAAADYEFEKDFAKSIQSDWEEQDIASHKYIEHRPCYRQIESQNLISDKTRTFENYYSFTTCFEKLDYQPIVGEKYSVMAGNRRFTNLYCIAAPNQRLGFVSYCGNLSIMDSSFENTGETVLVLFGMDYVEDEVAIITTAAAGNYRSYITGNAWTYYPLDEKYVPDIYVKREERTHWLETGELVNAEPIILEFTTPSEQNPNTLYNPSLILSNYDSGRYSVEWNGELYSDLYLGSYRWKTDTASGTDKLLGNPHLSPRGDYYTSVDEEQTKCPFLVVLNSSSSSPIDAGFYLQGTEPCTVTMDVYRGTRKYHTLDEKYIPETIARKSDITGGGSQIDALPMPPTASVGQFIRVAAVDENGRVTATEAVSLEDLSEVLF